MLLTFSNEYWLHHHHHQSSFESSRDKAKKGHHVEIPLVNAIQNSSEQNNFWMILKPHTPTVLCASSGTSHRQTQRLEILLAVHKRCELMRAQITPVDSIAAPVPRARFFGRNINSSRIKASRSPFCSPLRTTTFKTVPP